MLQDSKPGRRGHEEVVALRAGVVAIEARHEAVVQGGAVVGTFAPKGALLNEFLHEAVEARS